jgi:hypothetical protein
VRQSNLAGSANGQCLATASLITRYEHIDRVAMALFPIIFLVFNVVYWSYYLLLNDLLAQLW